MNFDIANLVINVPKENVWYIRLLTDAIMPTVCTFIGGFLMYLISLNKENKRQTEKEKKILIRYLYNINYAMRNIAIFYNNIDLILKWKDNPNMPCEVKNKDIPNENINFNFNEMDLAFLADKNHVFYENILQLKTELAVIYGYSLKYNKYHTKENINDIVFSIWALFPKLLATMENINNYLIKYYKNETLIVGHIKDNFDTIEKHFNEKIKLIEEKKISMPREQIEALKETREGWTIDFSKNDKK
jgi:hypothetical protein